MPTGPTDSTSGGLVDGEGSWRAAAAAAVRSPARPMAAANTAANAIAAARVRPASSARPAARATNAAGPRSVRRLPLRCMVSPVRGPALRLARRARDERQRGVHRRAGREEARVHDIQVVDLVRLAVGIQGRDLRILPEAD